MITKKITNSPEIDFLSGETILVDKPYLWSSFKVIHELRKIIRVRKVGHAGTLDPRATGLLIIATGKKTKEITTYQNLEKVYTGSFRLGQRTKTMDSEAEFFEEKSFENVTEELILKTRDLFLGEILQKPPMYSAVSFKGKKLYHYARQGKVVELKERIALVSSFEITKIDLPFVEFEIKCSKGTYIRVIADDFGEKLGCGAYLFSLRRTKIGDYSVEDAFDIDGLKDSFSITKADVASTENILL